MTIDAADRARVLVEALPYIKRFHGQKVVIKLGGHAMERKDETLLDIVLLRYVGLYLDNFLSEQPVCFAMHTLCCLSVWRMDEAKNLARLLVDPIFVVLNSIFLLRFHIARVSFCDIFWSGSLRKIVNVHV